MLITNLPQIAGYDIDCAYGMVSTTASMTRRVLKSTMGGARTAQESGTDGFSAELEEARKQAFVRLKQDACEMGAHAIVGSHRTAASRWRQRLHADAVRNGG